MAFRHSCGGEAATVKDHRESRGQLYLLYMSNITVGARQAFVCVCIHKERGTFWNVTISVNNVSIYLQAVQIQRITSSPFPVLSLAKQLQES